MRLFQGIYEVEPEEVNSFQPQHLLLWEASVVECEAPRQVLLLVGQANQRVELDSDGHVPLQRRVIELKPHLVIGVNLVTRPVRVEEGFHLGQNIEEVILPRRHDLELRKIGIRLT